MDTFAACTSRRRFLHQTSLAGASAFAARCAFAQPSQPIIKAVAFDALAIFDPRPVFRLAEELFPARGEALSNTWRNRQFEYTWLRNSMHRYKDFWQVTHDALVYAAAQCKVQISPTQRAQLMSTYLQLKPWPDVGPALRELRGHGIRLAILSNFTETMMQSCLKASGLESQFKLLLSTDQVRTFKPDPAAYGLAAHGFHLRNEEIVFAAFGAWDAAGAKAFGYPTYWVNRTQAAQEELDARPDFVCNDLSQLPGFVLGRVTQSKSLR